MDGFILIKTTFENKKEIVGVHFNGAESYSSFIEEVKNVYNIPQYVDIQVYSKDFVIRPNIFVHFVAQYINNLDLVLDIKASNASKSVNQIQTPMKVIPTAITPAMTVTPVTTTPVTTMPIKTTPMTAAPMTTIPTENIPSPQQQQQTEIPSTLKIQQNPKIREMLAIKTLENKHRTVIAKTIISQILTDNPEKRILREEFLQLAQSIVEIFPSEIRETYYVPFTKGRLAKGKLYDAYNNTRARLCASGIIKRRIKYRSEPTVVTDNSVILGDNDVDENQLEALRSGGSDWNSVLELWRKTHYYRQNEFHNENIETIDYMEKYKVLQNEKNYELFEIDFEMLYPQAGNIYEWSSYYLKAIEKAEKIKDSSVREILTNIENTWEEDSKLALSLLLIPYLLPSTRKISKLSIQESFISYTRKFVKDEDDDSNDSVKRLKLENHPRVCFVGDYTKTISFAYVDVYGRRHIFQNPLRAFEVCFRSFMAMNIKYPKSCEHVWLFAQQLIFQIITPEDNILPSINTLINDLQQ
ncbi:uncharacterized protein ACRADG_002534 [Cochliomyia hominivorax]